MEMMGCSRSECLDVDVPLAEDQSDGLTVARSGPADTKKLVPYGQNKFDLQ